MADEPTVRVEVTATACVSYSRTVNMPRSAYKEYERNCANGTGDAWFSSFAETWLLGDEDAWTTADYEDVEASLVPPKSAGVA